MGALGEGADWVLRARYPSNQAGESDEKEQRSKVRITKVNLIMPIGDRPVLERESAVLGERQEPCVI